MTVVANKSPIIKCNWQFLPVHERPAASLSLSLSLTRQTANSLLGSEAAEKAAFPFISKFASIKIQVDYRRRCNEWSLNVLDVLAISDR
jgi:hypothetical protein